MKRYKIILNPTAGAGNGKKALPEIENHLKRLKLDYELASTEYTGHAVELASQAVRDGFEVVVAAGGDGTVNEVLNGLIQARESGKYQPALGVLSVGRGNDFAGSVNIPEEIEAGCQALAMDQRRKIDIGRVRGEELTDWRYFANCVGVGFDAVTTIEVHRLPRLGGFLGFMIAVLKTIFLYNHPPLAEIQYDGETISQRSLLISIMNGRRLGGGFYMAPDSKPDDGLLDLCIARKMSSLRILAMIPYFTKGTQATQPEIITGRTARVKITAQDGPLPAQTDGEIISTKGRWLEIEVVSRMIEVVYQP